MEGRKLAGQSPRAGEPNQEAKGERRAPRSERPLAAPGATSSWSPPPQRCGAPDPPRGYGGDARAGPGHRAVCGPRGRAAATGNTLHKCNCR